MIISMLMMWSEIKCATQLFVRVPAITHRGTNYTKNTHLESLAALFGINLRARATGNYHCKFSMSSLISSSNFRLWANETWIFHTRAGFSLSAPDKILPGETCLLLQHLNFFRPTVIGDRWLIFANSSHLHVCCYYINVLWKRKRSPRRLQPANAKGA